MKLRKFFGLTSRSVLEQVRAELGADAMIVANHATPDGVEVTALASEAIDSLLGQAAPAPAPALETAAETPRQEAPAANRRRAEPTPWNAPLAVAEDAAALVPESAPSALPSMAPGEMAQTLSAVMAEVAAMRELIEQRFALMSFSETLRRRPLATRLTRDLLAAGFSPALTRTITERLPDDFDASQARDWVVKVLARNLQCVDTADEIVARGGVYALVGPTGVGKTTTTAKLAARGAVRYGAQRLALITTDSFRIGAQDQLRIYAKILGLSVHTVSDRHDLRQALDAVRGRHLVLIDTVGMGQRDARVAEQAMLLAQPEIKRLLLLNASAQGETLDEVVDAYGRIPDAIDGNGTALAGCIVTKQDEASRQGGALDVAIRHRLPVHYVTSGQRVPEDIFVPDAALMIERSLRSGAKPSAFTLGDEDLPLAIHGPSGVAHA
jgi:flagellar biosynthesis protein FlhF